MKQGKQFLFIVLLFSELLIGCKKDFIDNNEVKSEYQGSYKNIEYTEILLKEFGAGIYEEPDIPMDIQKLKYGRIEIDFRYNGGALVYFMPLMYYGSINKNANDNAVEEPKFHLAIEIGHYNVIPFSVEYLFYTISTYRQPQYCRDTFWPVMTGKNYTFVIDKKPEGIILQLKNETNIVNILPHAFFPDSSQLFFKDISSYIDINKGDTLKKVLMVGKGFAGIDKGIHDFNGSVSSLRIFKYTLSEGNTGYELNQIRNQHTENQTITYIPKDVLSEGDKYLVLTYDFYPYSFSSGELIPAGTKQTSESNKLPNNQSATYHLNSTNIGLYKIQIKTVDKAGNTLRKTTKPFEIWIYPKEWDFEFYKI